MTSVFLCLDTMARTFGARIVLEEMGDPKKAGNGYYSGGVIHLNASSGVKTSLLNVAKHEITHQIQAENPEGYRAFKDFVAAALYERQGETFEALVDQQITLYREQMGQEISRSEAEDEVVADATGLFLTDGELVARLAEADRPLGQRVLGAIRKVIEKIRAALKETGLTRKASAMLEENLDTLKKAEEMWVRALMEKGEVQEAAGKESGAGQDRRMQLNPDFSRQYDAWDKVGTGGYFLIGTTSQPLQSIGIESKKIYWDKSKIKKILRDHPEMTHDVIKQVPQLLEHPVIVMQSKTAVNRVVLLGELTAENGKAVLAALELRPSQKGSRIADFIKVASAYSKNAVQSLMDSSDILYVDPNKERTDSWLEARRLQLPVGLTNYGSIASVTYTGRDVNGELTFGEESGKTAMALAFEQAEKESARRRQEESGAAGDKVRFSIAYDGDNRPFVVVDTDILKGVPKKEWAATVKKVLMEKFSQGVKVGGRLIGIDWQSRQEMTYSRYTQWLRAHRREIYPDKLRALSQADEVLLASRDYVDEGLKHPRKDDFRQFARGQVLLRIGKRDYTATVIVGTRQNNKVVLYDLIDLSPTEIETRQAPKPSSQMADRRSGTLASRDSIPQPSEDVKGEGGKRYSLEAGSWREAMDQQERAQYEELDASLLAVNEKLRQAVGALRELKEGAEYQAFREKVKAEGRGVSRFAKPTPEDRAAFPVLGELDRLRRETAALREEQSRLFDGQYVLEKAAKERVEQQEAAKPKTVYTPDSEEAAARQRQAAERFGITKNFRQAGYLLPSGQMLDFRDPGAEVGKRSRDHREIAELFQGLEGGEAMVAFMQEGNIRIMPELPGLDIAEGISITGAQEQAIKDYVSSMGQGYFNVEFTSRDGNYLDSLAYDHNAGPDRVVGEIKRFLATGEKPYTSEVSDFHRRFQLEPYDEHQKENWAGSKNIVLYESEEQFSQFIEDALAHKIPGKKLYFGRVPEELAAYVRTETGVEIEGFNCTLRATEIEKIVKYSHGNEEFEAMRGQRAITKEDLLRIPEIIQSPDRVELSPKLYEGKPAIRFIKTVDGRTTVVTYVSQKHYDLTVQTMYAGRKKESLATASNAPQDAALTVTPEAHIGTAFNSSVAQPGEDVKENPRYQLEAGEVSPAEGKLLRENQKLREAVERLKEEFKLTKGAKASPAAVEKLARKTLRSYRSSYGAGQLTETLSAVYDYLGNDPEPNWETAWAMTAETAKKVLEGSEELDRTLWEETRELRQQIRETALYVSEQEKGDFEAADGFTAFRRAHMGHFRLVNDRAALSVDQFYQELCGEYPHFFDGEAVTAYEQLLEMEDFFEAVKPRIQNPFGQNLEDQAAELAGELLDGYFDIPQVKTFADRKQEELRQLRADHKALMEEQKREIRERYQQKLLAVKEAAASQKKRTSYEKWWAVQAERQAAREQLAAQKHESQVRHEQKLWEAQEAAESQKKRAAYEKWWAVQAEKLVAKERRQQERDRRAVRENRRKIEGKVKSLSKALLSPTDSQSIPEGMRGAVQALLGSLDLTGSKGADTKVSAAWTALQQQITAARRAADSGAVTAAVLDPDLEARIEEVKGVSLNQMTRGQSEELYKVLAALEKACRGVRIQLADGRKVAATQVAREVLTEAEKLRPRRDLFAGSRAVKDFFDHDLTDPIRFAERYGQGFMALYQRLRDGQDQMTRRWQEAVEYIAPVFKEAKAWKWQQAKAKEFTLTSGEKLRMTPTQVMELYLLAKRPQALGHIYGGGITVRESRHGARVQAQQRARVTPEDVADILKSLTPEQKKVADKMGAFLSREASGWGNEVSMELYGYQKFTEEHYWPLSADANYTVSQLDGQVKDGTLAGLGFTKTTVRSAQNAVYIGDAIDTYAKHITQMAAYNAFVPGLEEFKLVYNWRTSHDGNFRSVKEAIERVGGKAATQYIEELIKDINGRGRLERAPTERLMGNFKAAAIAGNLRVVVQQPTAYLRAAAEISPKYLIRGLIGKRKAEQMKTYAPIAQWKDWGYFEPGNGRQLEELMLGSHGMGRVVDSVFRRTQAMRSGNSLVKMSTAFMISTVKNNTSGKYMEDLPTSL